MGLLCCSWFKSAEEFVDGGDFLRHVSNGLMETVFDPFVPLGRVGGDGAGDVV